MFNIKLPLIAITAALSLPATADLVTSPPGTDTPGSGQGVAPFTNIGDSNGNRYQQVYSSDFFTPVGPLQRISGVAFRIKQGSFNGFIGQTINLSDVTIQLSTTPRNADTNFPNGLSNDLDTNHGLDVQTVYSGALSLTGDDATNNFDLAIDFQNDFLYTPVLGNLLLEVLIPATATVTANSSGRFTQIDNFTDGFPSTDGTASATDANLTDGTSVGSNSTTGAVTQFTTTAVPEPASLFALLGGLTMLGLNRRRTR